MEHYIFNIVGVFFVMLAQAIVIVKFILASVDKKIDLEREARVKADETERAERLASESTIDKHLNNMRDTYIHKDEFYRNMDHMKEIVNSVKSEVNSNVLALKELVAAKMDLVLSNMQHKERK